MSVFHVSTLEFLSKAYPPTLTVEQVSEITSEQPQTIRNLISQGRYRVPSFKIGRKRVFRLLDVAEYIDRQRLACRIDLMLGERCVAKVGALLHRIPGQDSVQINTQGAKKLSSAIGE